MGFNWSQVKEFVGKESGPIKALDDVSTSNVRHWYEMMKEPDTEWINKMRKGKEKPFPYMKESKERLLAEQQRIRERAVPLPMMMVWAREPFWTREPKEPKEAHELALKALEDAGYALTIGVKLEEELLRPVYIGESLSYRVKLEGISSDEEVTKLGKGYLVDLLYTFSNRQGEVVSKHKYTMLKTKRLSPVS